MQFWRVLLASLGLALSVPLAVTTLEARDAGVPSGGGGGEYRSVCTNPHGAWFAYIGREGKAMDGIRAICTTIQPNKTTSGSIETPDYHGGSGGDRIQRTCPSNSVVTALRVWLGNDNLVSKIDLTCTNLQDRSTSIQAGRTAGTPVEPSHLFTCNQDEVGVGIYGHSGALVDRIGLVCEKLAVVQPGAVVPNQPPKPTTPPGPAPGSTAGGSSLGAQIVAYAVGALGKCVDMEEKVRTAPCPPLAMGEVGEGECTHLVQAALHFVGATFPGNYVWGKQVTQSPLTAGADIQPGDVIQIFKAKFQGPNGSWETSSQHTAIVERNNNGDLSVLEQNTFDSTGVDRRYVTRGELNLNWTLVTGNWIIYRAEKTQGFARTARSATRTSGYRRVAAGSMPASVDHKMVLTDTDIYVHPEPLNAKDPPKEKRMQQPTILKAGSTVDVISRRPDHWLNFRQGRVFGWVWGDHIAR